MQYWENIEVGNKLELFPLAQINSEEKKIYLSKIQDILGFGELEIFMPMEQGKMKLLSIGTRYLVCFYTNGGIIQGECIVEKRWKEAGIYFLGIKLISRLSKKQRREYYRLECNQEIKYRAISGMEEVLRSKLRQGHFKDPVEKDKLEQELSEMERNSKWLPALLLDISGGGLHVKTRKKEMMEEHLLFRLSLYMDGVIEQIDLECSVVAKENVVNESNLIELRCKYLHITNQTRELIVRYIFDQQRKRRAFSQ